jgi:molybdate transport system substrate-binding protein
MKTVRLTLVFLLLLVQAGCVQIPADQPTTLTVSSAANVRPAFEEIAAAFTAATGARVVFNFGATGALAQQIAGGAPADVFAAANMADIESLFEEGLIEPDTLRPYAIGRLVLYSTTVAGVARVEDLARPEVRRIAIANPERAPYGVAAQEAMRAVGVFETVEDRLILGESVAQAFQYAETGNADVALVPLSLTIGKSGEAHPVPESLHRPIMQAIGVVRASSNVEEARAFVDFVTGPVGREILSRYGYDLPQGEPSP